MAPRRSHRKSRDGCDTCKRRRVKCDETGPPCTNCIKREIECVYGRSKSERRASGSSSTTPKATHSNKRGLLTPVSASPAPESPENFNTLALALKRPPSRMRELELIHHFSTSTFMTVAREDYEPALRLWRDIAPQEAQHHEFLLNGIFALTSLHLAYLRPWESYYYAQMALEYQDMAIQLSREPLSNINDSNGAALVLSSLLTAINAIATASLLPAADGRNPVDSLILFHDLIKGVESIWHISPQVFPKNPVTSFSQAYPLADLSILDTSIADAFANLRQINKDHITAKFPRIAEVCGRAIDVLEKSYARAGYYDSDESVCGWLATMGDEFAQLLRKNEPMALAILAFFGALLANSVKKWWFAGYGQNLVEHVAAILPACGLIWEAPASWALQRVRSHG